ncbi:D-inositol-3-phosphate glycosyltransferase [Streptomyces sp. SudanB25_2051]
MDNRPSRGPLVRLRSSRRESPDQRRPHTREIGGVLVRIGLLTQGGYPYASGESRLWCDRLVRGLPQHEFDIYALGGGAHPRDTGRPARLPSHVRRVRTAPGGDTAPDGTGTGREPDRAPARRPVRASARTSVRTPGPRLYGRRDRRRFAEHLEQLATALCRTAPDGDSAFADGLYGLADLAVRRGGLGGALRSECAVRVLEAACRAPGARRSAHGATVADHLAVAERLERALLPLSLDWYGPDALGSADLCHAASAGEAALPGLLAKRFFGTPLLVTEYGVQLRAHYLAAAGSPLGAPVRSLLAAFHGRLATEVYRQAALVTPGNAHTRRWQERCGADRAKLRTVYPGMEAERFAAVGEGADPGDPRTLVWVGRAEPAKDLVGLLHAFAEVRRAEPGTRLRIVAAPVRDAQAAAYLAHCRALAEQLFPDEAATAHAVGDNPVSFEEVGGPEAPRLADAYAAGCVIVLSSVVEGFPVGLVEAMLCGRATVSTDVGAVVEVIGGTGLVVPPRNPRALAEACVALLRDPERRARLGAAARARALELFTVEQNVAAFRALYLEALSLAPVRREAETLDPYGDPLPFAHPAEAYMPGHWTTAARPSPAPHGAARRAPAWAAAGARVSAPVQDPSPQATLPSAAPVSPAAPAQSDIPDPAPVLTTVPAATRPAAPARTATGPAAATETATASVASGGGRA